MYCSMNKSPHNTEKKNTIMNDLDVTFEQNRHDVNAFGALLVDPVHAP